MANNNEIFETLSHLTETTVQNCKKCGEANLEISSELFQEQAKFASALLEAAKASASKAAGAKDYQSLVANQAELAQEIAQLVWASSKNCAEIISEAAKTYNGLFEQGLKTANTNFGGKAKGRKSA